MYQKKMLQMDIQLDPFDILILKFYDNVKTNVLKNKLFFSTFYTEAS